MGINSPVWVKKEAIYSTPTRSDKELSYKVHPIFRMSLFEDMSNVSLYRFSGEKVFHRNFFNRMPIEDIRK